jgi:NarL family two-component system sensor histidine kinase LiaS
MRKRTLLVLFGMVFGVFALIVSGVLFALRPFLSYQELIEVDRFYVPAFLYIIVLILFAAAVVTWIAHFYLKNQETRIKDKLHWLYLGKYEHSVFNKKPDRSLFLDEYCQAIQLEIELLRKKMLSLSRDVQQLSANPQQIGNETKEEILEQERHRIARELHDSVSQQLFAAMMMLSAVNERAEDFPEKIQKQMRLIERIINDSQSEMRALLLHLRPTKLEGKSLKKGIEQLLVELKSKVQINIKWEIDDVHTMSGIEDHLFRIVQELLSNTLRHAKASQLEVYLKQTLQEISLRVYDDGVGFDTSIEKSGSYGLMNIKERVQGMGGGCKIISFPKKGTVIEIRIPNTNVNVNRSNAE